ncbi:LLM class flavin-dependent oxidoreductase [Streptomyces sp. NPDC026672]|uniref:LLM class flavin-dependent oxidoreductase n=1 Tax=unclassified Streptomyces TaxID=2593676 RepID=UPI0033E0603A
MTDHIIDPETIEFGLDTFLPVTRDAAGNEVAGDQVVRNTVEEAVLADQVGVDSFNVAEHYREGMMDSAGVVVLAGIAGRTRRIRLGTAVTVLSTQDPVRLFTEFSTLDAISDGRAQIALGRGSLTDSFPLFGYDLADYEKLFDEKLDLFTKLLREQPVTWSGTVRSPLTGQRLMPPLPAGHLPTWVAVGGSKESVVRAARFGHPLILAIIAGDMARFRPYVDLYHRALKEFGRSRLPVGVHSHGYIAPTDQEARDIQLPHLIETWNNDGRLGTRDRAFFEKEITHGAQFIGSPETVASKIADKIRLLGLERFDLACATGPMQHEQKMATIELYGREVIPLVRDLLRDEPAVVPA